MDDTDEWQFELWPGRTVDIPTWLTTRPAVFAAGVLCGLLLALTAVLVGLVAAYG